jgi:hypothetical protein
MNHDKLVAHAWNQMADIGIVGRHKTESKGESDFG